VHPHTWAHATLPVDRSFLFAHVPRTAAAWSSLIWNNNVQLSCHVARDGRGNPPLDWPVTEMRVTLLAKCSCCREGKRTRSRWKGHNAHAPHAPFSPSSAHALSAVTAVTWPRSVKEQTRSGRAGHPRAPSTHLAHPRMCTCALQERNTLSDGGVSTEWC
jgi:hypothetical protein